MQAGWTQPIEPEPPAEVAGQFDGSYQQTLAGSVLQILNYRDQIRRDPGPALVPIGYGKREQSAQWQRAALG